MQNEQPQRNKRYCGEKAFLVESLTYTIYFITENFSVFELATTGYLGSAIFLLKKITLLSMKGCLKRLMAACLERFEKDASFYKV